MKNKHFNLTSGIVLILIPLVFSFTGCKDDYETYYEGYGLVSKSGDEKFTVKLDDGYLLYPREYYFNPEKLNDSTRLRIRFNILEEQDTNLYARIVYADTILTKSILPYDETILDSVGNAPVKIVNSWFAHGFLNFEFMFAAHLNPSTGKTHMVNLLQCPTEDDRLIFEFRHNDFGDSRDKLYFGTVSFPIQKLTEGYEKPIKMIVKYNDSANTPRSIELTYK